MNDPAKQQLQLVAAMDWEFTHSERAEFSHALPWWLLLEWSECYRREVGGKIDGGIGGDMGKSIEDYRP